LPVPEIVLIISFFIFLSVQPFLVFRNIRWHAFFKVI
jgi:hypothetical protein